MIEDGGAAVSIGGTGIPGMPFAAGQDGESVREMVKYLADCGHRKIVFACGLKINTVRTEAFLSAVKELKLSEKNNFLINCADEKSLGAELAELMRSAARPSCGLRRARHDGDEDNLRAGETRRLHSGGVSVAGFGDDVNFRST